jgi:phenylpyruvate tautomerase PptA (4-oxalocrotonate tautomerase family)
MPMIDVYAPKDALSPDAEQALTDRLTTLLIGWEGFDPADERMRAVSWAFVHHPDVYVGGAPAIAPRYKVVISVPEGQLDEQARAGVVADVTEAVLDAEKGAWPRDASRIWVFPTEIPDGHWGGRGRLLRLPDILRITMDRPEAEKTAAERIAASRAARA